MSLVLHPPTTVAVIGAGLSGLTAARRLVEAGAEVVVYEARDRVGGRAWTITEGFADGQHADMGPELVAQSYHAMMRLCVDLGVELSEPISYERADIAPDATPLEGYLEEGRVLVDGQLLTGEAFAAVERELKTAIDSAPPEPHEVLDQWARRTRLSEPARAALLGIFRMPDQSDLNELDGHFLFGTHLGEVRRVVGGTQRFPEALAEGLDILLNTPIRIIRQGGGAVYVIPEGGEAERYDRVLVTAPFHVLATIGFDPPLHPERLTALNAFRPGIGGKVVAQYQEGDAVREALTRCVFSGGVINTLWVSNPYVKTGPAVVTGFICGSDRKNLERPENAIALLDEVVATVVGHPVTRLTEATKDWTADPWALAMATTPGEALRGDMVSQVARPYNRIHFAGDYTDAPLCGTMEGAVRSGQRAADEILRRPKRIPLAEIDERLVRQ